MHEEKGLSVNIEDENILEIQNRFEKENESDLGRKLLTA